MKQPQLSVDLAPHEQQLGKYRLVAKLGQGGMGTVYLALASGLGSFRKLLVVKELRHDLPWRESSLSMFMDEAQLAARLDHPNVLQTFEAGEADGRYFLAMEYLDGQPLSSLIDNSVPLELHVYILCEVLQGLQYAHDLTDYDGTRLHVVHRDVSPQNVFITHHGQVKVVDFGVAKANNGSNITSPGVFKGKFAYAAPEQLLGRPVDGRCDVFAVGVMLWEAIAGRRFGVPKPTVDAFRVRTQGLEPRIAQIAPDVDPLLAEICEHALAVDPLERVESADALRTRLQEWLLLQGEHIQAKQLAAFMRERFNDERSVRRRIIERAMVDAGASQSMIAELPRECLERESGMAPRVEAQAEQESSQHSSSSGISPSHRAYTHKEQPSAAPAQPQASRREDSVHSSAALAPRAYADESSHALQSGRPFASPPSRLSSAAVLLGVAAAVFLLTYQLSRRATEPGTPQLRSSHPPSAPAPVAPSAPSNTESTTSAATSGTPTSPSEPAATTDPTRPQRHRESSSRDLARDATSRDASSRGLLRDSASRDSARDSTSRDAARDSSSRDSSARDAARDSRDFSRDSTSRDAARDSASRDFSRDSSARDTARDSASRDFSRDSSARDAARDSNSRDFSRDSSARDAARDSAARDFTRDANARDVPRDSASRDFARDSNARDLARDSTSRDVARDSSSRDLARDATGRDTSARSLTREPSARDASRDAMERGATSRDPSRDTTVRDSAARDSSARGLAREPAARESARDSTERGATPRDAAGRDSSARGLGREPAAARAAAEPESGRAPQRTAATTPAANVAAPSAKTKPAALTEPVQPTRTTRTRAATPGTRADPNMGGDLRQLRNNGPMRIDTEDPYQ